MVEPTIARTSNSVCPRNGNSDGILIPPLFYFSNGGSANELWGRTHKKNPPTPPIPNMIAAQAFPFACSERGRISTRRARSTAWTSTLVSDFSQKEGGDVYQH